MNASSSVISSVPTVPPANARVAAYDWRALTDELDGYGCVSLNDRYSFSRGLRR
jgi:hypothetical protein